MAKPKQPSLIRFLQSYHFGKLLASISIISLTLLSFTSALHSSAAPKKFNDQLSLTVDRVKATPPKPKPAEPSAAVLGASTQPPLETYQGPFEPIPADPNQQYPPVYTKIPTNEPVVFLGIDDGWVQKPETLAWLTQNQYPFTLFLTDNGIKNNYNYFLQLQNNYMTIENHTLSHPDLTRLNPDQQKAEICGAADKYETVFGNRPTLFRPPYGKANQVTLQAAKDCGMKAIIMWHALVDKGSVQFQDGLKHLEPGDIVLMHFNDNFIQDIQAFINQVNSDGLQVARLEDWVY